MACLSCTIRRRNEQMEMEMKRKWESMQREKKTHNGVKKYTVKTWKRSRNERMV